MSEEKGKLLPYNIEFIWFQYDNLEKEKLKIEKSETSHWLTMTLQSFAK